MSDPWFKFYPQDWRADTKLRLCSRAARGLWIDMLTIMHEAEPRGELLINEIPLDAPRLARLLGEPLEEIEADLKELESAGVFSRKKNKTIYSRRMVSDEKKRRISRENGKKGGNPSLGNDGGNSSRDNPPLKAKKLEARSQKLEKTPYNPPEGDGQPDIFGEDTGTGTQTGKTEGGERKKLSDLVDQAVEIYREVCVPACGDVQIMSSKRTRTLADRLKEAARTGDPLALWRRACQGFASDPYWTGKDGQRRTKGNLDNLIRPDNFARMLEAPVREMDPRKPGTKPDEMAGYCP